MHPLELDIRTLCFVTVLFAFGLGTVLISFALVQRSFTGLKRVGFGFACIGLGFLLIGLRDHIPPALSVVAANTLLVAGFVLINDGIRRFLHAPPSNMQIAAALLLFTIAVFIHYTYFNPNVQHRIFWISLLTAVLAGVSWKSLRRETPIYLKAPHRLISLGFTLFSGFMLFRALWVLEDIRISNFMSAGNIHGLAFLAMVLLLLFVSFGLVWMANAYLQNELKQYERIISATPDMIMLVDKDGVYSLVNDAILKNLNKRREDVLGKRSAELFGEDVFKSVSEPNLKRVFAGDIGRATLWLDLPVEGRRYLAVTYHPVPDSDGRINFAAINARDITDLDRAQRERQRIFDLSFDMLCIAGMDGYFKEMNPAWTKTLGWSREELMRQQWVDFVHPEDIRATVEAGAMLMEGKPVVDFVNRYRTKDGYHKHISWNSYPDLSNRLIFAVARDISDRIQMEEELKRMAEFDPLTGAYNRRTFMKRLSDEMERSLRYRIPLSLLMLDIDHFKVVNDTYGHPVGDQVLKKLVAECAESLRSTDMFCRMGGEEFTILLPHTNIGDALVTAERIRVKLSRSTFNTNDGPLNYTVSVGVTEMRPDDADESVESILKRVDDALYLAKNRGRNRVERA